MLRVVLLCSISLAATSVHAQSLLEEAAEEPPAEAGAESSGPEGGEKIIAEAAGAEVAQEREGRKPYRMKDALPGWLELGLQHRQRVETLDEQYRVGDEQSGGTAWVLRTLVSAKAHAGWLFASVEGLDARAYATETANIDTTSVDTLELLQAHVGIDADNIVEQGDHLNAKLGRMTLDVGSRRLVARNRFRNTINGFTGVDIEWTAKQGHGVRGFAVVPVQRLPTDSEEVLSNDIAFDEELSDTYVYGGLYQVPNLAEGVGIELYLVGVHEKDSDRAHRHRRLQTPGARLFRKAKAGHFDGEIESMVQFGTSKLAASDTEILDHQALFTHLELGYSWRHEWKPRVALRYDYASGDDDPNDNENNRFDTLFGARRWEFGPTGIYGPFSRSNLNTPGISVNLAPHPALELYVSYRHYWLASDTDAWVTTDARNLIGTDDSYLGQQGEVRLRWAPLSDNLKLEVGAAHYARAGFAVEGPGGKAGSSTYLYLQLSTEL